MKRTWEQDEEEKRATYRVCLTILAVCVVLALLAAGAGS